MNKAKEFIKSKKGKFIIAASAAILVVIIVAIVLLLSKKEDKEAYRTISVSALSGTVMAENNGSEYKAYEDMKLYEGYALRIESDSFARLVLDNDKYIKLEENSKATFEKLGKDKTGYTTINLQYGAITNEKTTETEATCTKNGHKKTVCVDLMWQRDTLKELSCADTQITYLDLGWCGKLISLNVRNCPLACINLEDTPIDVSGFQSADNIYKYNVNNETSIAVRNILGLNASKITHVTGADFDATTETFTNITGNKINYLYDCGNGVTATFSIQIGN